MKRFRAALLQLDSVSPDTTLQVVKQAIHLNSLFFDSFSLQPPTSIDELFQRGNKYAMLKDDVVAATKRTVASTSDSRGGSGSKGKVKEAEEIETLNRNGAMVSRFTPQGTGGGQPRPPILGQLEFEH